MGNYFVLTVSNVVADCHIQRVRIAAGVGAADALAFSDHFWEFEDDRVMTTTATALQTPINWSMDP